MIVIVRDQFQRIPAIMHNSIVSRLSLLENFALAGIFDLRDALDRVWHNTL